MRASPWWMMVVCRYENISHTGVTSHRCFFMPPSGGDAEVLSRFEYWVTLVGCQLILEIAT